jgi:hypothetical protein
MRRAKLGRSMTDHDVRLVRNIKRFSSGDIEAATRHLDDQQSSIKRVTSHTPVDTLVRVGCHCHLLLVRPV